LVYKTGKKVFFLAFFTAVFSAPPVAKKEEEIRPFGSWAERMDYMAASAARRLHRITL